MNKRLAGRLMSLLTLALILVADLIVSYSLIFTWYPSKFGSLGLSPLGLFIFLLYQLSVSLSVISHFKCMFTDPGKTPKYPVPGDIPLENVKYCADCEQWKPPRTHHCRTCKICYHKMDHHCPWVNNCIAVNNQKYFILFLFYISFASLLTLIIIGMTIYEYLCYEGSVRFDVMKCFFTVLVGFEAIIFLIFTGDFLREQLQLVLDNQTTVESYQDRYGIPHSVIKCLSEVLGKNSWMWLLPVSPSIDINYLEPCYSYEERMEMLGKSRKD
ncbi:unnamed protein product [Blepharisma stoltei]|uniref:Palmitoyltransferase n=1 Tax=Blepharisma stoltei TaxID=1481888 RepID=A0AAU9IPG4_9CILI|nr:unnamed protein product [Blepharisma stoltei]